MIIFTGSDVHSVMVQSGRFKCNCVEWSWICASPQSVYFCSSSLWYHPSSNPILSAFYTYLPASRQHLLPSFTIRKVIHDSQRCTPGPKHHTGILQPKYLSFILIPEATCILMYPLELYGESICFCVLKIFREEDNLEVEFLNVFKV